jgi:GNAT superfamily N-acetyltransferase
VEFLVRKAVLDDAYDFTYVQITAWKISYKGIVPDWYLDSLNVEETVEKTKNKLEMTTATRYVGILDGKIIAILSINLCFDEDQPEAGEIGALFVLPEYQSRGYGKQMESFAIAEFKNRGIHNVVVWTLVASVQANVFYKKCGFELEGSTRNINIINMPAIRYCKDI